VVRDELTYRKELRLMDEFSVDLELVGISKKGIRFRVRNAFRTATGDLAASVTSGGVWFDLEHRRPRIPPPDLDNLMRTLWHAEDFAEIPDKQTAVLRTQDPTKFLNQSVAKGLDAA